MPKLSIITINLNTGEGLKKTFDSVFKQVSTDFEYLVIDGASTDNSVEVIKANADKITYYISEKDGGIFNAMNKGIVKANGDYLLFLNSGDYFYSPESLCNLFKNFNNEDIIYGNLLVNEEDGKQWILDYPGELSFGYFYRSSLPHQAALIKRKLFDTIGLYNEDLKIASDYEFFMNAICMHNCTYRHVNEIISVFCMGGISTNPAYSSLRSKEKSDILNNQYKSFLNEHQDYIQVKAELNKYKNSRAHQIIEKIIKSPFYKKIKK
jgi:glycosyltransferase involved in cell wall biosynthesis